MFRPAAVLGLALLMAACGSAATDSATPQGRASPTDAESDLTFPTQDPTNSGMDALAQGTLAVRDQCLYLVHADDSTSLPIWPHGFTYEQDGEVVTVLDQSGGPVAATGDRLSMGGGMAGETDSPLAPELRDRVGDCEGPYWIVSDVV